MIKNYFRILKKPHAYLHTILKTPVKFQKDWTETVGGVKGTKYPLKTRNHAPRTTRHAPRATHHAPRTTRHAPRTTHHAPRPTENQKQCPSTFLRKGGGQKKCRLQTMNVIGEARLFIDLKQTLELASARVIWITRVYLP